MKIILARSHKSVRQMIMTVYEYDISSVTIYLLAEYTTQKEESVQKKW